MKDLSTATEKIDPLTRIQEEIKEVVRREQEYRQLSSVHLSGTLDEDNEHNVDITVNDSISNEETSNSLSISPVPSAARPMKRNMNTLSAQDENLSNTPSLVSSVHSKESLEEHHSDDSGISASSSPVNGTSSNNNNMSDAQKSPNVVGNVKEQRYIGPNCYNLTPEPPQQRLLTRTISTPHLAISKPRQFNFGPAQKGFMQRFIASRGKLQLNTNNNNASHKILLNSKNAAALFNASSPTIATPPNTPLTAAVNTNLRPQFDNLSSIVIPTATLTSSVIERDSEGRPIRPGFIPVELKIQRELKDLKTRESELKKIRKTRQSTSDLLDAIDNENVETDDENESEVEHCYGPGKLRSAKSISELCDASHCNNSISPRATPSPDFYHKEISGGNGNGMRPAVSLAQLCDLDPEDTPSSHRLIAQWESLIQRNA